MTDAESEEMHRRLAEVNRRSENQSGKNGYVVLTWKVATT